MRTELDLSGWWHTCFDAAANWKEEPLADPRTALEELPAPVPSGGWDALEEGKESMRVPGTWDASRPGYRGVAWHWRPIVVPPEWQAESLWLRFEGVRLRAQVYVDRLLVGNDLDGLTPFLVDVTDYLVPGRRHELLVRVTFPGDPPGGNEPAAVEWAGVRFPPGPPYGGIFGGVALLGLPAVHLAGAFAERDAGSGQVIVRVQVRSAGPARRVGLTACVLDESNRILAEAEPAAQDVPGRGETDAALPLHTTAPLASWSPEAPALYRVAVDLAPEGPPDGSASDHLVCRVGLRYLGSHEAHYLLNGRPLEVRAAASHGLYAEGTGPPAQQTAEAEVRAARTLGLNALLFSGHMPSEPLLDAADRLGLLLLVDPALAAQPEAQDSLSEYLASERLRRLHAVLDGHPSVLWTRAVTGGWILAGVPDPAPVIRALEPRPGMADLPRRLAPYGDRVLPGSQAERWRGSILTVTRSLAARGLGAMFPDVAALSHALNRAAMEEAARAVEDARSLLGGGFLLPAWTETRSGAGGLVTLQREPTADSTPLARANAPLHLVLSGLPQQAVVGVPHEITLHLVNRSGVRGPCAVSVRLTSASGDLVFDEAGWVDLAGEEVEELGRTPWQARDEGEHVLSAALSRDGQTLCAARRTVWVTSEGTSPLAASLATVGLPSTIARALDQQGVRTTPWVPDAQVAGLLLGQNLPGGLLGTVYAGAVKRMAWLVPEPPDSARLAEAFPALRSVERLPCPARWRSWLIGGRHPLLAGVGGPGIWRHVAAPLLPMYGLRDALGTELVTVCCAGGSEDPQLLTALALGHLGEAELLFCALPLAQGLAEGVPVARRLLGNIARWLAGP